MQFCFYPNHENRCPNVSHGPHLGGAALGTLVHAAGEQDEFLRYLHGTIDAERKRNTKLVGENERLRQELEQVKLELKLERQNKFATNGQKEEETSDTEHNTSEEAAAPEPKKRGAPFGHPGWFRPTPSTYDWAVDVLAPRRCPCFRGHVTICNAIEPDEHLQEDILDGVYRVVLYRHPVGQDHDGWRDGSSPRSSSDIYFELY